jgi:pimeloyl-ACP methyl ester carboxylesterase
MQKPHLLLIHGFPHDATLWEHQINALSDVAQLIAPDLRGFGSNAAEPGPDLRIEDYATDLLKLLNDRGIEKVIVAGLSMGGYVALSFLEKYPDRVRALILCNTRAEADDEAGRKKRYEVVEKAMNGGVPVIARELLPKMLAERTKNEQPEEVRKLEEMMLRQPPEAIAAASKAMATRKDQREFLRSIKIPVLIITGDQDPIMPLPTSELMHTSIIGSEMNVLKDAAHLSNIDRPAEFNAAVRDFLQKLPAH